MDQVTVSRELLRQVLDAVSRSRETAMRQTLIARIPESGLFGGIAQDLDWVETELRAALEQETSPSDECLSQPAVEPARPYHVYSVTKSGSLTEWEPTTMAFALPDGKHALYTAPQAQQPPRIGSGVTVEQTLEQWEHDFSNPMTPEQQVDWVKRERDFAARQAQQPAPCSDHPGAPHGFDRNRSHSLGRYVCDCEGWRP